MASKLVKNATVPTAVATAAMMVTTAAWKRRSHASAACTLGSTMLGIWYGWGVARMLGVPLGSAAGEAARRLVGMAAGTPSISGTAWLADGRPARWRRPP